LVGRGCQNHPTVSELRKGSKDKEIRYPKCNLSDSCVPLSSKRVGSDMYALFKLQEPMLFRGSMEFSPNVRGPKTIATSLILPTPSTIAGALATFYLDTQKT